MRFQMIDQAAGDKNMIEAFKQIDWPARDKEVKSYIALLKMRLESKLFTRESAKRVLDSMSEFLFLYKTITGGDLKMTRMPGEKLLHDSVKKLNKEINKKVKEGNKWISPDGKA